MKLFLWYVSIRKDVPAWAKRLLTNLQLLTKKAFFVPKTERGQARLPDPELSRDDMLISAERLST